MFKTIDVKVLQSCPRNDLKIEKSISKINPKLIRFYGNFASILMIVFTIFWTYWGIGKCTMKVGGEPGITAYPTWFL